MNMKKIYKPLLLGAMLAASAGIEAQHVSVSARIDSTALLIGEQTLIHLEATQDAGQHVQFPLLGDTIVTGVEVLDVGKPDTVRLDGGRITVRQDVLVTSFDSALYYMPPFRFAAGSDTLLTEPLALKVTTFDVDTESKEYFDIKGVKKAPFVWADYFWEIFSALVVLFLIVWGIYFYRRWKYRKDHPREAAGMEPELPPYEAAIQALDRLKEQKLWQRGFEKEYYTALTDILRIYMHRRFGMNAMEMTSSEILDAIRREEVDKELVAHLRSVLDLADFVKFAKMRPVLDDNEQSMAVAYEFVNGTPVPQPKEADADASDNDDANTNPQKEPK